MRRIIDNRRFECSSPLKFGDRWGSGVYRKAGKGIDMKYRSYIILQRWKRLYHRVTTVTG